MHFFQKISLLFYMHLIYCIKILRFFFHKVIYIIQYWIISDNLCVCVCVK